jgi:hypothetical protein
LIRAARLTPGKLCLFPGFTIAVSWLGVLFNSGVSSPFVRPAGMTELLAVQQGHLALLKSTSMWGFSHWKYIYGLATLKLNSVAFSPQANYIDHAAAACWRS